MIISEQQAHRVAEYLRDHRENSRESHAEPVPSEVVRRAIEAASSAPDPRPDRVREARDWLDASEPDPYELADKMLSRIMADRLR